MGKPVLTEDEWTQVREEWERNRDASYAGLAAKWGVSRVAVWQRSQRQGWHRPVNGGMTGADDVVVDEGGNPAQSPDRAPVVYAVPENSPAEVTLAAARSTTVEMSAHEARALVEREAIAQRRNVISRHRKEWNAMEARLYPLMRADWTPEVAEQRKSLKTLCEALGIKQLGERRAWGLDAEDRPDNMGTPSLTINRVPGLKIVR